MRILLLQPDDDAALDLADELEADGASVRRIESDDPDALRDATPSRPDALIVCLDAAPDAALDLAESLAQRRRVRGVPMLFVGGDQLSITKAQELFPRASFARRDVLHNAVASLRI